MGMPKAYVSWSSGKDSAFALQVARLSKLAEIVGVLVTVNVVHERVAMHGVRDALLDRQIAALGLPAIKVPLPSPCSNEIYEERMEEACATMKAQGASEVIFGDLFLEDIRAYREEKLRAAGMTPIFPLWGRDTGALAQEMIAEGLLPYITCLDPRRLDRRFAGRRFDESLLREFPADVDPCGENGEFHTVVLDGPMFRAPIAATVGETVERDGFVFTDMIPG
jgi:uncharacterized protein (TIGR00290 family)